MPVEEGWVYGQKLKDPEAPSDLEGMMEAAGVPDSLTNGTLPFSPEWYAGAKERQRLRDIEKEKLLFDKADARHEWAELMWTDLSTWGERLHFIVNQPEPLADLQALLARTRHERPDDVDRFKQLQVIATEAETRQWRVRKDLGSSSEALNELEAKIREKEAKEHAEELDRIEKKRIADKRKRKAERALRRNEALLRGEDPPPLVEDSEAENAEGDEDGADLPVSPASAMPSPDFALKGGSRPATGLSVRSFDASPDHSVSPSPPLQRGGPGRELPPIQDPPVPPPP